MSQIIGELETLINQGQYFLARSKAENALLRESNPRIIQLHALAISKSGMPELALESINPLYQQNPEDPETAGILGSIYKELFKKNQKTAFAILSRDTYLKNFLATKNYYTGINAASMSAMAGQGSKAREIANQVIELVEKAEKGFWEIVTLGEAYLLVKNRTQSIESFVTARKLAGNDWGKVTSVHNQLWLLNHYLTVPSEAMKLFSPPNVVAFSGHMIDQPGRETPRFPPEIESQVKDAIRNSIRTMNARIGYSSLACGSDILFVEAMLEEGGEINLLLPFKQDDFIKTSLEFAGQDWVDRFKKICDSHDVKYTARSGYNHNDELFSYLSRIIYGSAILRSSSTHAQPYLLTVSSEIDLKRKTGGTKDTVNRWPYPQRYINVNPDIYTTSIKVSPRPVLAPKEFTRTNEDIRYLAYLDTAGTIDLSNKVSKLVGSGTTLKSETHNDSVIVYSNSSSSLMEFIDSIVNETKSSFKSNSLKIILHCGVIKTDSKPIEGDAVNELLSICNQVELFSIYSSEMFAALLALSYSTYDIQYAGVIELASESQPFYHIDIRD